MRRSTSSSRRRSASWRDATAAREADLDLTIISPVYGCTDCLRELARRTEAAFAATGIEWELILVDDRGPDDPWSVIQELSLADPRVRGVQLMRNHGQHLAIWAGFEQARGKWVAVLDCDLQDDPSILPELYQRASGGEADAVIVERGQWHDSFLRRFSSRLFHHVMERLSGFKMNSNSGNFGIYSRQMVKALLAFEDKEVFLPAMAIMTGLPRDTFTVPRSERLTGRSSYSLRSLLRFASALIVRFSDRPLKLSVVVGLLFSTLSATIAAVVFIGWLIGSFEVEGWTSLMLSVWFIGGLILFALGIHGFYIGRIFNEVQRRPRINVKRLTWEEGRE